MAPDNVSFRPAASIRSVLFVQFPRILVPPVSSIQAYHPLLSSLDGDWCIPAVCLAQYRAEFIKRNIRSQQELRRPAGAIAFPACRRRVEVLRISRSHMRTQPRRRRSFLLLNASVSAGAWWSQTEVYGYTKLRSATSPQF